MNLQRALPDDAAEIAELLNIVWPNENVRPEQVAKALHSPNHSAHLAIGGNHVVGIVSGFKTQPWEVDLLAVHPESRGRGIAYRLIQCSTEDAADYQCDTARALIEISNNASQRAFEGAGYASALEHLTLYVSRAGAASSAAPTKTPHIIPVVTLTYTGAWIEEPITPDGLAWARGQQLECGWQRLGTLCRTNEPIPIDGFEPAGTYTWWFRDVYLRSRPT